MEQITSKVFYLESLTVRFGIDEALDKDILEKIHQAMEGLTPKPEVIIRADGTLDAVQRYKSAIVIENQDTEVKHLFKVFDMVDRSLIRLGIGSDGLYSLISQYKGGDNPPWKKTINDPEIQLMLALQDEMRKELATRQEKQ